MNYAPKIPNYAWIMQIAHYCTIFLSQNFFCFNLVSLQIFFGFTLNTNYPFSKCKHGNKVVLPWNKSKQGPFFFPSCDWLYFFHSWHELYKKTRTQFPMASSTERLECLVDLRYLWILFATKQWLFAAKMYYIYKKKFPCISQGMKKHSLLIDLPKFLKIMCHYRFFCFFRNYVNYALRAKLCDFASAHNSRSPAMLSFFIIFTVWWQVFLILG